MSEPVPPEAEQLGAIEPPKGALGIVFLIVFLDLMGFGIIIPLLPFYVKEPAANPFKVTLLFSAYSICQFIGAPILGAVSDRKGRKPVLALSQLGSALGYALLGIATQRQFGFSPVMALTLIYASRVIDGFTGGNISTAQAYISDITSPEKRSRAMAIIGAAFGIGFSAGPFLGGVLGKVNVSLPAYVAGAFSLFAAIVTAMRLKESRVHKPVDVEAWLHPSQFKPVLRKPIVMHLLMISFVTMGAFVMMEATIGIFLNEHFGYKQDKVGWFFGYIGIIILIVQGGILRRMAKGRYDWSMASLGPLLVALGMGVYCVLAYHRSLGILLVAGALTAIGRSFQGPTLSSLLARYSGREEQGVTFGMYNGLSSLARVIGPLIAGAVYPLLKNAGPFATAAVIALAGAVWTIAVKGKTARSAGQSGPSLDAPNPA
jgi:MFS transporter, DHA1 family, tetracycline resistance protein